MAAMDNTRVTLADFLSRTPQGSWRITGTRVSLDSVIHAFWDGATPEEICQDFPSLSLAQIYSVLAYYLTHRNEVDAYLQEQQQAADKLREDLTARHGDFIADLRRRLLARRQLQSHPA